MVKILVRYDRSQKSYVLKRFRLIGAKTSNVMKGNLLRIGKCTLIKVNFRFLA